MSAGTFVGLDVCKNSIQIAVRPTGEQWSASGNDGGINETADRLRDLAPDLVVMEAHGGPELPVAGTLAMIGLPFALVSPRNVREFAKVLGKPRSDRDQAELLAHFAELIRPEIRPAPREFVQQLKALQTRREDILQMLAAERKRSGAESTVVMKDLKNHIYFLEKSIVTIDDEISRTVRASRLWI